jgi:hypothetical protein
MTGLDDRVNRRSTMQTKSAASRPESKRVRGGHANSPRPVIDKRPSRARLLGPWVPGRRFIARFRASAESINELD